MIRSGTTPSCSEANQAPVRQKPVWISSAISSAPLSWHQAEMAGRKPVGRDDEAALALDRLDQHGGHVGGADLGGDDVDRRAAACSPVSAAVAERVGHRHPVDLGGERAEALLVGHVLRGQRHRQVGAAVVGVVEHHDRGAAGEHPDARDQHARLLRPLPIAVDRRDSGPISSPGGIASRCIAGRASGRCADSRACTTSSISTPTTRRTACCPTP